MERDPRTWPGGEELESAEQFFANVRARYGMDGLTLPVWIEGLDFVLWIDGDGQDGLVWLRHTDCLGLHVTAVKAEIATEGPFETGLDWSAFLDVNVDPPKPELEPVDWARRYHDAEHQPKTVGRPNENL